MRTPKNTAAVAAAKVATTDTTGTFPQIDVAPWLAAAAKLPANAVLFHMAGEASWTLPEGLSMGDVVVAVPVPVENLARMAEGKQYIREWVRKAEDLDGVDFFVAHETLQVDRNALAAGGRFVAHDAVPEKDERLSVAALANRFTQLGWPYFSYELEWMLGNTRALYEIVGVLNVGTRADWNVA